MLQQDGLIARLQRASLLPSPPLKPELQIDGTGMCGRAGNWREISVTCILAVLCFYSMKLKLCGLEFSFSPTCLFFYYYYILLNITLTKLFSDYISPTVLFLSADEL